MSIVSFSCLLVGAAAEEEAEQFEGLQSDQLTLRGHQLEHRADTVLHVKSRYHCRWVITHQACVETNKTIQSCSNRIKKGQIYFNNVQALHPSFV